MKYFTGIPTQDEYDKAVDAETERLYARVRDYKDARSLAEAKLRAEYRRVQKENQQANG